MPVNDYPCSLRGIDYSKGNKHDPKPAASQSPACHGKSLGVSDSDPFYLEETLTDSAPWRPNDCYTPYDSNDLAFGLNPCSPSSVNRGELRALPVRVDSLPRPSESQQSTPLEVKLEQQRPRLARHRMHQILPDPSFDRRPGSTSTVGTLTVPSLTSTNSIASTNSVFNRLDAMMDEVDRIFYPIQDKAYSPSDCPSSPTSIKTRPLLRGPDESRGIPTMQARNIAPVNPRHHPANSLPVTPRLSRDESEHLKRKISNDDPDDSSLAQMQISFLSRELYLARQLLVDHGLFMSTDDDDDNHNHNSNSNSNNNNNNNTSLPVSPVSSSFQSPVAGDPSSPTNRTGNFPKCESPIERSVWEPDSDSESEDLFSKTLSRKPIETLRKVRSKVQLRKARSSTNSNSAIKEEDEEEEIIEKHYPVLGNNNGNNGSNNNINTNTNTTSNSNITINDNNDNETPKDTHPDVPKLIAPSETKPGQQLAQPTVHEKFLTACSPKSSFQGFRNNQQQDDPDDSPSSPPIFTTQPEMSTWPWHRYEAPVLSGYPQTGTEESREQKISSYNGQRAAESSLPLDRLSFMQRVVRMFRDLSCYNGGL